MPRLSLVTGATGFVGRAVVRRLLAEGETVRAVVLPGDPLTAELRASSGADRLEIVEGDVTDFSAIAPAFTGVARVFHVAALVHAWAPWSRFRAVNVGGTQNVARAAREHDVERLVHVSTTDVFGMPHGDEPMDEGSPFRLWDEPYPDTKIEAEMWLWPFAEQTALPLTVIYPGWVYGPGDRAFFPGLCEAIEQGILVFWKRDLRLDWVYVDNLADACIAAGADPAAAGQGYIVHDDTAGPTLRQVCAELAAVVGKPAPRRHVPYRVMLGAARVCESVWRTLRLRGAPPLRRVDVKAFGFQWQLSAAKIRRHLGWTPRVDVRQGMQAALDDLRQRRGG
jgi:2-alkyl-3-oxoalkanoate reductase